MTDPDERPREPSPGMSPEWEHRRQPMNEFQERLGRMTVQVMTGLNNIAFRLSDGRVGGEVPSGAPICLLTTTGRKTGRPRTVPLLFLWCGDDILLVASNGGMSRPPYWYLNLLDDPVAEVSVDDWKQHRVARVLSDEEKAEQWPRLVDAYMHFENYRLRTERNIPLVMLSAAGERRPVRG